MRNLEPAKNGINTSTTNTVTTKTKYRDFTDFLGRKQNQEEVVSPQAKNGDEADNKNKPKVPYSSYKEFLENYNTKKFSSVKPAVPMEKTKPTTVKSEIFIQVNGDSDMKPMQITKNFASTTLPPPPPPQFIDIKPSPVQKISTINNAPVPPPPPQQLFKTNINGSGLSKNNNPSPQELFKSKTNGSTLSKNNPTAPSPPPPDFLLNKRSNSNGSAPPPVPEFLENLLKKRAAALQKANNDGEINTMTYVPVVDETDRVDKNDPNVKKLVYNTYRGLLGAYNNKANDIISTLPRHCVREDKGIAKQLESIALQGGLDKLNGRVHPDYRDKE